MTTLKSRLWNRRSRTSLYDKCPSSAPQVAAEQPTSLHKETASDSKHSLSKVLEYLHQHENLTKVENMPRDNPRVKHFRDQIRSAMPFLIQLSSDPSSSNQIIRARRMAEDILASHSPDDNGPKKLAKKSSTPSISTEKLSEQPPGSTQGISQLVTRTRAVKIDAVNVLPQRQESTPVSVETTKSELPPNNHQIALLAAVHNALHLPGTSTDSTRDVTSAPPAVSAEELLSMSDSPTDPYYLSTPSSALNLGFNPSLPTQNVPVILPSHQSSQPFHQAHYQSTPYISGRPAEGVSNSVHVIRGNANEPVD